MKALFDHERLEVYQAAIVFIAHSGELIEKTTRRVSACDHLDRASTSIALNIAEGNGKSTMRDRSRFLEIAKGSALECAACLDVMGAKCVLPQPHIDAGKALLLPIVRMLSGLITSCLGRVGEDAGPYGTSTNEQEQEKE